MTEAETELNRLRKKQQVILAYHRVFNSEDGKIVLEDFEREFQTRMPRFRQRPDGSYCTIHAALLDGQFSVVSRIMYMLDQTPQGDADPNLRGKVTVKKE